MKPEVLKSWSLGRSLEIDYSRASRAIQSIQSDSHPEQLSRAPCLGADQKVRGLWERDWFEIYMCQAMRMCHDLHYQD